MTPEAIEAKFGITRCPFSIRRFFRNEGRTPGSEMILRAESAPRWFVRLRRTRMMYFARTMTGARSRERKLFSFISVNCCQRLRTSFEERCYISILWNSRKEIIVIGVVRSGNSFLILRAQLAFPEFSSFRIKTNFNQVNEPQIPMRDRGSQVCEGAHDSLCAINEATQVRCVLFL